MKNFHSRVICPQNTKLGGGQTGRLPHAEQATGQGIHCKEILFIPRCSQRAREFRGSRSTFLYDVRLRSYRASNLRNFRIFAYFLHTKTAYSRMITIFPCGSRKGATVKPRIVAGSRIQAGPRIQAGGSSELYQ